MSRTDKDAPWWVRAEWYKPVHYNCPFDIPRRILWQSQGGLKQACDLPAEPTRGPQVSYRWRLRGTWPCHWEPVYLSGEHRRYRCTWGPGPVDRRLMYWKPDRHRVRQACRKARHEYNGFGEPITEVPMFQHRHAETTGGGWWD